MLSLQDLKATEVVHVTQDNMADLMRFWSEVTNSFCLLEDDQCFRIKSSFPHPLLNTIIKSNFSTDIENHLNTTIKEYHQNQVPFLWRVWNQDIPKNLGGLLLEKGAVQISANALMAIDLETYHPMSEPLPDLKIKAVRTAQHALDFSACCSSVFKFPILLSKTIFEVIRKQDQNIESFVGYIEATPVATGTIFYSNGVAGIYNVTTLPAFQGRGIGVEMMTTMLLKAKLDEIKTTILHSTPFGLRLFERLGFQHFGEMKQYLFTN
jgi:ribosomal protein S18 acetylase RimI-like enzyme